MNCKIKEASVKKNRFAVVFQHKALLAAEKSSEKAVETKPTVEHAIVVVDVSSEPHICGEMSGLHNESHLSTQTSDGQQLPPHHHQSRKKIGKQSGGVQPQ